MTTKESQIFRTQQFILMIHHCSYHKKKQKGINGATKKICIMNDSTKPHDWASYMH